MCGLAGIFDAEGGLEGISLSDVTACIQHRGPDAHGSYGDASLAVCHTRLSILDLSEAGSQPFVSSDDNFVLAYNGEIYNFKSLREELKAAGIQFKSESDTEVLLHLLMREGERCLNKLNGFFAFAFFDKKKGKLILGRDRMGIKPFYYSVEGSKVYFSSELRAVMAMRKENLHDRLAMASLAQFSFIHPSRSAIVGVQQVPRASCLIADKSGVKQHYYSSEEDRTLHSVPDLEILLTDAVQTRLVADVAVGTFLSGGLDSTIISALANRLQPGIQSFSLGIKGHDFVDESDFARSAADFIGTQHHSVIMHEDDCLNALDEFLDVMDEPFGDSSALAFYLLSKYTREHVKVVLSGDGADELFGGYNRHRALLLSQQGGLKTKMLSALGGLSPRKVGSRENRLADLARRARRFSEINAVPHKERYSLISSFSNPADVEALFGTRHTIDLPSIHGDYLSNVLMMDQAFILPGDMLVKVDRMSMAHGLEVRVPFLDYRVVQLANQMSSQQKLSTLQGKLPLRKAFAKYIPEETIKRPKHGFEIPVASWLRGPIRPKLEEEINYLRDRHQDLIDASHLQQLTAEFLNSKRDDLASLMWSMLCLGAWLRKNT